MQGRPPAPNSQWVTPVWVIVKRTVGGPTVLEQFVMTDTSGSFTLNGLTAGGYVLWLKGAHTLAVLHNLTLLPGTNTLTTTILPEGDAVSDNVVNISDFSGLAAAFGASTGMPAFNAQADFNNDGTVNISDFSLLASTFGQVGAPMP
ncbi:MAG: hypothetical protein JNL42_14300 [Anaerolineae bacterium]|nr:hypothetical protein [Anaerolineae bacterium]